MNAKEYGVEAFQAMTEKKFMADVIKAARVFGWKVFHVFDSRRSPEGFPDLVLVRKQKLMFAELKSEKGKLTKDQEDWIRQLIKAGTEVHIWRPHNWDMILEELE